VLNDPGDDGLRAAIENRLLARHTADNDRSRLVPIFTDREAFARAAGLSGSEHASVLILDRDGRVLARAEGAFDENKAQALRETVLAQND
jgi:predicted transcriptional regulator